MQVPKSRLPTGVQQRVELYMDTTDRFLKLLERRAQLRDAGKDAEAKELIKECKRLKDILRELMSAGGG